MRLVHPLSPFLHLPHFFSFVNLSFSSLSSRLPISPFSPASSALGRPTLFPLPGVVAKAIFGEFGDEVLLGNVIVILVLLFVSLVYCYVMRCSLPTLISV
jgi:hypothetical protein